MSDCAVLLIIGLSVVIVVTTVFFETRWSLKRYHRRVADRMDEVSKRIRGESDE